MSQAMQFRDANGNVVAEYDGEHLIYTNVTPVILIQQSPQGHEGKEAIDKYLKKWTLDGKNILVNGEPYHWGWAYDYLMWDDVLYHRNDSGYVHELLDDEGNFMGWSPPGPDPREGGGDGNGDVTDTLVIHGSLSGSILTIQGTNPGFKEGDGIIIPATQGRGKAGPGGTYPGRLYATEQEMKANAGQVKEGGICGVTATGFTWTKRNGAMVRVLDTGSWYLGYICPRAYFANITKINGNQWTLSKAAVVPVPDATAYYDGSVRVMNAISRLAKGAKANLNAEFPGWKRVAVNGMIPALQRDNNQLTCDSRGSFELFSPPGTPCMSIHWRGSASCFSSYVTLRGNWGDDNYGLNWESSTNFYGYHGLLTDDNPFTPSWATSGHEFWQCTDCNHQDADVYNVPNRATGGEGNTNCWSLRIKDHCEYVMRQYIQWQMQYASTVSKCGLVDCEIDSVALIPGAEIMHGHGDITRLKGRNIQMAMNNASGTVDTPQIVLEKDCMVPLEGTPAWYQYAPGNGFGVPCINLNANAGTWALDQGITLISPKVDQSAGWLHPNGVGLVGVEIQDKLPKFKLVGGCSFLYPAKRKQPYDKYTVGANGIKCSAPKAQFDGTLQVTGECVNEANNWNIFVTDGIKGPNYKTDCPPGGVCFNWQIS